MGARLSDDFVLSIVERQRNGETARRIADFYGVRPVTVHKWVQMAYKRGLAVSRGPGNPQWLDRCSECGQTVTNARLDE